MNQKVTLPSYLPSQKNFGGHAIRLAPEADKCPLAAVIIMKDSALAIPKSLNQYQ
jgi:hypothetical protein